MNKQAVSKQALKQKHFHEHYSSDSIEDWVITLVDSGDTLKELWRNELYWMYKLKTYASDGLNEKNVCGAF